MLSDTPFGIGFLAAAVVIATIGVVIVATIVVRAARLVQGKGDPDDPRQFQRRGWDDSSAAAADHHRSVQNDLLNGAGQPPTSF